MLADDVGSIAGVMDITAESVDVTEDIVGRHAGFVRIKADVVDL